MKVWFIDIELEILLVMKVRDTDCNSDDGVSDGDSNDGDNDVVRLTIITMVMS